MTSRPVAHRGLHGAGVSENGLAAFAAAFAAGYGAECDVRASRDGVPFVFHDARLSRMAGVDAAIMEMDAAEIDRLRLPDGGPVPRLSALLALDRKGAPLLIEIKAEGRHVAPLCAAVAQDIAAAKSGPVAIMSFNPRVPAWFVRQRNGQLCGLVITQQGKSAIGGWIERTLALWMARPDFLACDIRDLPSPLSRQARAKGLPVLSWTVRSEADQARAAAHADQAIFEHAGA